MIAFICKCQCILYCLLYVYKCVQLLDEPMNVDGMSTSVSHQQYSPQLSHQHKIVFNCIRVLQVLIRSVQKESFVKSAGKGFMKVANVLMQGAFTCEKYILWKLVCMHILKLGNSHCARLWSMTTEALPTLVSIARVHMHVTESSRATNLKLCTYMLAMNKLWL